METDFKLCIKTTECTYLRHVYLVKYHVYQQLKVDEQNVNLTMTMPQFDERWNIVFDSLWHFENGC